MRVRDQEAFDKSKAMNDDPYGAGITRYAIAWADLMEHEMADGKPLVDIAESASQQADTEGITGFMYGCAVGLLAQCWEHGEALRRWHNKETQIGDEGDRANESGGVLNPAVIVIGR